MKGALLSLFVLLLSTPVFAQTVANGSYYAVPAWDQTLPAAQRFIVLANFNQHAVLDREPGLVWERTPSASTFNWFIASSHCIDLNLGGRTGWRLPTVQELLSVVDRSQSNPSLPSGHPFIVQPAFYYSVSTNANGTTNAWGVSLNNGGVGSVSKNGNLFNAWCLRGGQGVDPQ